MLKKIYLSVLFVAMFFVAQSQEYYPYVLGFAANQGVECTGPPNDTFNVSFSGGSPFATQWDTAMIDKRVLSGFRHDISFVENAFSRNLFTSKGFYSDYVQLRWDIINYANQITGFRVYRKELGSSADSTEVANLPATTRNWRDEYAETGTMYQYTVFAEGVYPQKRILLNMLQGIGFRVPYGRISGRVTYEGGAAVQDVEIIAQSQDELKGSSIYLNGTNSYLQVSPNLDDDKFKFDTAFAFQGWFLPDAGAGASTLFEKEGQYKLTHATGQLTFEAGTEVLTLTFNEKVDTFFHAIAMRSADSIKLIALYDNETIFTAKKAISVATAAVSRDITFGRSTTGEYFKGHIDEVRVWHKSFPEKEIITNAGLYIAGTEDGLSSYYRFNEGVGNYFYDLAREGFNYYENHGYKSPTGAWVEGVTPSLNQLAVKGITDKNGNYIIAGIPYKTDGTIYNIVPSFGVHSFDPSDQILFMGLGSTIHNNVNFIDIASFPVIGEVYYKDTYFPVEGVSIKVDGRTAVNAEGLPITTDARGLFNVDVPIGQHFIQLEKLGHSFEDNGRFPKAEGTFHDFQEPLTFQSPFKDTTLIKVIGKIVGGPVQAAKSKGLGKTVNNLGQGSITLTTQKGYDLTNNASGVDTTLKNEFYSDGVLKDKGETGYTIGNTSPKQLTLSSDPETGEYVTYLLPEKYTITNVTAGTYTYPATAHTTLDLTNAFASIQEVDSTLKSTTVTPIGDTLKNYGYDSISYNKNHDLIYRTNPNISVTNKDGDAQFWESKITAKDGTEITVVNGDGSPKTAWPIFVQRNRYTLRVSVFESYTNNLNNISDEVPVSDGVVNIQNGLSTNNAAVNYQINDLGYVDYSFAAGLPNIVDDFTNALSISSFTGNGGTIQTQWQYTNGGYTGPFKAYTFGGLAGGSNFVTTGPNAVDMVLRDPYGSESFATFEKGSSFSRTTSRDVSSSLTIAANLNIQFGAEVKTFAGLGAGVIIETSNSLDENIGLEYEETLLSNNTTTSTITSTQTWSTSSDPDFVGAKGDVFIGHSTNIVYGVSKILDLIPQAECVGCATGTDGYDIGIHKTIRVNPKFGTAFQFSQTHIANNLIPNLIELRDNYLKTSAYHTSVLPLGSEDFGRENTTTTESRNFSGGDTTLTYTGDSYNFALQIPGNWPSTLEEFVDTVKYYNEQIKNWENILAQNEQEKLNAKLIKNLSFDAGVVYASEETYEGTNSQSSSFEFSISPTVGIEVALDVMGVGFTASYSETANYTKTDEVGKETASSVTFAYELADGDEGDYYSMDVKDPGSATGPVFSVKGGQTACPYLDAELTQYYQPGTLLSQATVQREVPQINCDEPIQINVPEDQAANFEVKLANISQSGDDGWYTLSVDESTNQDGAVLSIDGVSIKDGRAIYVPSGEAISKIISVSKTLPAVNDYENIALVLSSSCQNDPSGAWDVIADTVFITAKFKPVCTSVTIESPADLWVRNTNTGDTLNIAIADYNLAHNGFESVLFQYKSTSSSLWTTDKKFFVNQADYQTDIDNGGTSSWINGQPDLTYPWDMSSLQDRNYDVRALTTCADGTENNSEILTGIKDSKRPKVFGTPQPGDGILSPGEDISIRFDETIQAGLLLGSNFSVRGELNGAELRHSSSIYFDGVDDYASAKAAVNLEDKSFSIEYWTKRATLNEGVIFNQADIEIGFNSSNQLYVTLGSETITTTKVYDFTDKWIHHAISYDYDSKKLNVYTAYDGYDKIDLSDITISNTFSGNGRMYVGNNSGLSKPYNGLMHDFRIWEKAIGQGSAVANMTKQLSGGEIKLSGFWPMDELNGELALDESRSHHLTLNGTQWRVLPSGYAHEFDGSTIINIPTASSVVISNEMDFTLGFWFKASPQANTVLFSNGKADGSDISNLQNIWVVGINENGDFYTKNNGVTITETGRDFLDNEWHHFALVMKREANTSMYFDGKLGNYTNSEAFGGLIGANMTLGAKRHYTNGAPYSEHFVGKMDEIRIWKLARTAALINMDLHAKLQGNEKGLAAYYPFEKYDLSTIVDLVSSLDDATINENTNALTGLEAVKEGTAELTNLDVPLIRDARPVQNLAFNWVVNNDEIIINIEESEALIEKRVIEFTVDRIEDLNENRIASPVTWTAFIKNNTVVWNESQLNFVKNEQEALNFNVDMLNLGGVDENYTVTNIPTWLTLSSTTGVIGPDNSLTINFEVDPNLNIGTYEEDILLTTEFGYSERLTVRVEVKATEPDLPFDPSEYAYSMNVIGEIEIDGTISTFEDDKIIAYVDDEIRGIATLTYLQEYDKYVAYLNIYSNNVGGDSIEFNIWNSQNGEMYVNVMPNLSFADGNLVGTPSAPQKFSTTTLIKQKVELNNGWTWVSFPIQSAQFANTTALLESVNAQEGDAIISQTKFDNYSSTGWLGNLSTTGYSPSSAYKIKLSSKDTLVLQGTIIDPDTVEINVNTGWNWIGFVSINNMSVADAMRNFVASEGDILKSQFSFAYYDEKMGWVGNLEALVPHQGYMLKTTTTASQFTFPKSVKRSSRENISNADLIAGFNPALYSKNMSIIATSNICDELMETGTVKLAAYNGSELRGVAKAKWMSSTNEYVFFLTTYANNNGEELRFEYILNENKTVEADYTATFTDNSLLGSPSKPEVINIDANRACSRSTSSNLTIDNTAELFIKAYPNPFNNSVTVEFGKPITGQLRLLDALGKELYTKSLTEENLVHLDRNTLQNLVSGLYMIQVTTSTQSLNYKIIKE